MRFCVSKPTIIALSVIAVFTLSACGGGGGSNSAATPVAPVVTPVAAPPQEQPATPVPETSTEVLVGAFIDAAVEGLRYSTPTQSGITDASGYFSYVMGEQVTFSIGDIVFPAVNAAEVVSPLDIFAVDNINDTRVLNMARLLQTLDQDGIPGNGITITDMAHTQANGVSVDFGAANFDQQVNDVVANSGALYTALITPTEASTHLNISLNNMTAMSTRCEDNTLKPGYTGTFSSFAYEVSGTVEVMDNCTLRINMFTYVDGGAPGVRIYAGNNGIFTGSSAFGIGQRFDGQTLRNETMILNLPAGKTVADFDSLSVWCFDFDADFGSLRLLPPQ